MRSLTLLFLSILVAFSMNSQVAYNNTYTADELVQNLLIGTGVAVNGVSSLGPQSFTGQLMSTDTTVTALSSGVAICTGLLSDIYLGPGSSYVPEEAVSGPAADMLAIANSVPGLVDQNFYVPALWDMSGFEFDFIPYGDHLEFSYAFLSSEYEEFENSQYNDVFAFFLSGPGIEGQYESNAVNLAVVPNFSPDLPITVSSINAQFNSEWYVPLIDNYILDSRGRTKKMTIEFDNLQIGETYHIAFAIADGSDSAFDSIVLLEEGSFSASTAVELGNIYDLDGDGLINVNDLLILTGAFGCIGPNCEGDFNEDGITNFTDMLSFLANF